MEDGQEGYGAGYVQLCNASDDDGDESDTEGWATPENPMTFVADAQPAADDAPETAENPRRTPASASMRAYSVDVEWMDASELARDFGREHPASEHAETWSRPLAEDDDVKPILEYRPHEVPTTSEAAADGGARDIPPLTSDQCSAIKGAMAGVRMAYQPQWAAAMPEEQWMGLVKEKASRQPRPALKP